MVVSRAISLRQELGIKKNLGSDADMCVELAPGVFFACYLPSLFAWTCSKQPTFFL